MFCIVGRLCLKTFANKWTPKNLAECQFLPLSINPWSEHKICACFHTWTCVNINAEHKSESCITESCRAPGEDIVWTMHDNIWSLDVDFRLKVMSFYFVDIDQFGFFSSHIFVANKQYRFDRSRRTCDEKKNILFQSGLLHPRTKVFVSWYLINVWLGERPYRFNTLGNYARLALERLTRRISCKTEFWSVMVFQHTVVWTL